ncbi:MAG: alpha/beta fold hydrolase [Oceanicaulis sp.]
MADASDISAPIRDTLALSEGEVAVLRWPARDKPRLVFAHANGFCASAARRMLAALSDSFDILAPDLRGHGRTRLPAAPSSHKSWAVYARDLAQVYAGLDRPPDFLAGHSMGASSTLLAAAGLKTAPPLALIEPVVLPGPVALSARTPVWGLVKRSMKISKIARNRTSAWPDIDAVRERYRAKPNFARWAPGVLEDYLSDGLVETSGGVALACEPAWEAANYEAQAHDLLAAMRDVQTPVRVFKAEHGSTVLNAKGLARRGAAIDLMDGVGHLAVMEQPERAAAWVRQVWEESA